MRKASKSKKDTTKKPLRNRNERKRSRKVKSRKVSRKISRKRSKKVKSRKLTRKIFGMSNGEVVAELQPPDLQEDILQDICTLIPSHINNKKSFTDILNVEKILYDDINTVFKDPSNGKSFKLINKHIAKGANGYIFEGTFNGTDIVIKSIPINTKDIDHTMLEMIVQAHLACGHNSELEQIDSVLIPKVYFIAKSKKNYFIGTEKLNGDLHDFIKSRTHIETKSETVKELIFKISRTLLLLQKKCNFVHGDLHASNIMYKGDIKDPKNLKWYIIDFGMSAINIRDNETKSDNIIVLSKYLKQYKGDAKFFDSYDLRLLFLSLAANINMFDDDFMRWFAIYLVSPATYLSVGDIDKALFHLGYDARHSDRYLSPEFILSENEPPYVKIATERGCNIQNMYLSNLLDSLLGINSYINCSDDEYEDE